MTKQTNKQTRLPSHHSNPLKVIFRYYDELEASWQAWGMLFSLCIPDVTLEL